MIRMGLRYSLITVLVLSLVFLCSAVASATVTTGLFTLNDTDNGALRFNFTSGTAGATGHVFLDNFSYGSALTPSGNAASMPLNYFPGGADGSAFNDSFARVPNGTINDPFFGLRDYAVVNATWEIWPFDVIAYRINDSGTLTYAALYATVVNEGDNITFLYKYNNQSGNSTLGSSNCSSYTEFSTCVADTTNNCDWFPPATCAPRTFSGEAFIHDIPGADCFMLPEVACDGVNNSLCFWDSSSGSFGQCQSNGSFNSETGFTCGNITNSTFCNNQPFTARTGLCTFNVSGTDLCEQNTTKDFDDVADPPVFSCSHSDVSSNQSACEDLANTYYLPCGWNNVSDRCEALFIDFGRFDDFEDIGSENTCLAAGGTWREETAFDPLNNQVSTEKWCEFGTAVKTFGSVGGSGSTNFNGNSGQLGSCNQDCFACEFNSTGGPPASSAAAQTTCEGSLAGCSFRADTNAFNGRGWCEPSNGFGGFNCEEQCGDCNFVTGNVQTACTSSPAACRFENETQSCIGEQEQGCGQSCGACEDQTSCSSSSQGCSWDGNFCGSTQGAGFGGEDNCFNGVDDDNNGKTDCEDFNCAFDPFCTGGVTLEGGDCFKYDSFAYGAGAQANCTANSDCAWASGFGVGGATCKPKMFLCFENDSLQTNAATCDAAYGGDTCLFDTSAKCDVNFTLFEPCFQLGNLSSCSANAACSWIADGGGRCEPLPFARCDMNSTVQSNNDTCIAAGCAWLGDSFGGGHEGFGAQNCVAPCFADSVVNSSSCVAANGSVFPSGTCEWEVGECGPAAFLGGCPEQDGDYLGCSDNDNCIWFEPSLGGPRAHPNGSTSHNDMQYVSATQIALGLEKPTGSANESVYTLNSTGGSNVTLIMTKDNAATRSPNISQVLCNGTAVATYNFTSGACTAGTCNAYNTTTCGGNILHYFINNVTEEVEVLWEVATANLVLDAVEGNTIVTTVTNKSTVRIDGNISEQTPEFASSGDNVSNASRVLFAPGLCEDAVMNTFFEGMDDEEPLILANDAGTDATGGLNTTYVDLLGIGVKKTDQMYMYSIPVADNLSGSALCRNLPINNGQSTGTATNGSKYFLYLDTDGVATGACAAYDNASLVGFEYFFKYIAQIDGTTNQLSEELLSQQCSNGSWTPSNVALRSQKQKSCDFIGGPVFGLDKDSLSTKSNVNTSVGWRAYGTSTNLTNNATVVLDRTGPGTGDFRGIDAEVIDCTSTADKDNAQCTKFKQFGFFPGEFGPACDDSIDNDGNGLTDCDDYSCQYDPFFCSSSALSQGLGVWTASASDTSSPLLVWTKTNKKLPTMASFIFDSNEPANGSVKFFGNDSNCRTINQTLLDAGLTDGLNFTNFRPHHEASVRGLSANTTYFYKYHTCDPSGNCAVGKCKNLTTAVTHTNVTAKFDIPTGATMDIKELNLSNYSGTYAIKASTEHWQNITFTVNFSNGDAVTFNGVDIFEKKFINLSLMHNGTNYTGIDQNQYENFKQKTGVDNTVIVLQDEVFDNSTEEVFHCDDSGANCKSVDSAVGSQCSIDNTTNTTTCTIPDAVGLGFSTYSIAVPSSSSSSSSGGSGGGSGSGGGGGGAAASNTSIGDGTATDASDDISCTEGEARCSGDQFQRCSGGAWADAAPDAGFVCDNGNLVRTTDDVAGSATDAIRDLLSASSTSTIIIGVLVVLALVVGASAFSHRQHRSNKKKRR